jgi:hypothetical protein
MGADSNAQETERGANPPSAKASDRGLFVNGGDHSGITTSSNAARRAARKAELQREIDLVATHDSDCAGEGLCSCGFEESRAALLALADMDVSDETWALAISEARAIRRAHRRQQGLDPGDLH